MSPPDLFDLLATNITHLPFDAFTGLLRTQPGDALTPEALSSLTQIIINRLIDHSSPPNPDPTDAFGQDTLATCFLPFAANTRAPEDNARLSWAIETLLRLFFFWNRDEVATPALAEAVEEGILARERRVGAGKAKAGSKWGENDEFREHMRESAKRMRIMLEFMEASRGERRKGGGRTTEGDGSAGAKLDRDGVNNGGKDAEALEAFWKDLI